MTQHNDGPASDGDGDHTSPFRPAARKPVLHRVVPVSQDLPGYRGGTLRRDLLAGVTVGTLVLVATWPLLPGPSHLVGLPALVPSVGPVGRSAEPARGCLAAIPA